MGLRWLLLLLSLSGLVGCSPLNPSVSRTRAADQIQASFEISPTEKAQLKILKTALEKEFLLESSLLPQTEAPQGRGLQARIVTFRQVRDRVYMFEANAGHLIATHLPRTSVLAEFPIVEDTPEAVTIDFNEGMRRIFTAGAWIVAEARSSLHGEEVTEAKLAYIESARIREPLLEIHQILQIPLNAARVITVEARYFLRPYRANAEFEVREAGDFRQVGYFAVSPLVEPNSGRTTVPITRWDARRPITFAISANTPPPFIEAIREGVLYWNRAFGREVVRVEMAPPNLTAPDPRFNLIQWVSNDAARKLSADILADPRTGEILHAQIYVPSALELLSKMGLPALLRRLSQAESRSPSLRLRGFDHAEICETDLAEALARSLPITGAPVDWLRSARDYTRYMIAHEVGHALGLRHNFAGSLAGSATPTTRDRLISDYLLTGRIPLSESFTSTVMEYLNYPDAVLAGVQIGVAKTALPYDQIAIDWGYVGRHWPENAPLFCTDTQEEKYRDCRKYDTGRAPIVANAEMIEAGLLSLPALVTERFLLARTAPDPRDRREFKAVPLDPKPVVDRILDKLKEQIAWLGEAGVPSIAAERLFAFNTPGNEEAVLRAERESVRRQVIEAGGAVGVLFALIPGEDRELLPIAQTAEESLAAYLNRPDIRSGIGFDGQPYALSDEDITVIRAAATPYFRYIETKTLERALDAFAQPGLRLTPEAAGADLEALLASSARFILLRQTTQGIPGTDPAAPPVAYQFQFKRALRLRATRLLARSVGTTADWSAPARREITAKLNDLLKKATRTESNRTLDLDQYPRPLQTWITEQAELIGELTRAAQL